MKRLMLLTTLDKSENIFYHETPSKIYIYQEVDL